MKREDLMLSVTLDHSTDFVMEVEEGYKFLDFLLDAKAITGYGNKVIKDPVNLITVKFMTKQELKEIQIAQALDKNE